MKLSREEVQKIADLARLELSEADLEKFSPQLSAILEHIEKLNELDVSKVEPTAHAVLIPTPLREDEVIADDQREAALAAAPDREGNFFKVPKVI